MQPWLLFERIKYKVRAVAVLWKAKTVIHLYSAHHKVGANNFLPLQLTQINMFIDEDWINMFIDERLGYLTIKSTFIHAICGYILTIHTEDLCKDDFQVFPCAFY